ncbi:MAG: hypothetical protein LQ351_007184 [Letrouitia transgressa]|nr:MAG: hypothetical protein LQ351_007184 [Letrouitia transgressa]
MALFVWPLLVFLIPLPILAGPLSTESLSPYIASLVPTCAQSCLRAFLAEGFPSPACLRQWDRRCLCTRNSISGLTLGEGALRCLASECSNNSRALGKAVDVYEICRGVRDAKPKTHPTLTATHVVVQTVHKFQAHPNTKSPDGVHSQTISPRINNTASRFPTAATTNSTTPSAAVNTTDVLFPSTSPTSYVLSTTLTSSSSSSSSTSLPPPPPIPPPATAPTNATLAPAKSNLTAPEIAGVAVGSVAAAGLAFAALFCVFCLRRRKTNKRNSGSSFGGDKIIESHQGSHPPSSSGLTPELEHGHGSTTQNEAGRPQITPPEHLSDRWSNWRENMPPGIGLAVAPEVKRAAAPERSPVTPISATSYRTTSQLLPDKPRYSLFPQPRPSNSHLSPVSPIDQQTVDSAFDRGSSASFARPGPHSRGMIDTSQPHLQGGRPSLRLVPSDPFLDSKSEAQVAQRPRQYGVPIIQQQNAGLKPSTSETDKSSGPTEVPRNPIPAHRPTEIHRQDPAVTLPTSAIQPSHYQMQPAVPAIDLYASTLPVHPPRRKSRGKHRHNGRRPSTHYSSGSDTSFEDDELGDDPPHNSALSPVVESPPVRPRTTGVRYPVIPTSAAESPSVRAPARQISRQQRELNPASDRSTGKRKASPKIIQSIETALPSVPELAGNEPSDRRPQPQYGNHEIRPGSAKYKILVAPGLEEGIDYVGSPKSKASGEWTPLSTPTKKTKRDLS